VQRRSKDTKSRLREMPKTIELVGQSVLSRLTQGGYRRLRDIRFGAGLPAVAKPQRPISSDPQSQELFRSRIGISREYQLGMEAGDGGVQRSEAQAAVFMTTLDTLRMKMLGYRLVGRGPEFTQS